MKSWASFAISLRSFVSSASSPTIESTVVILSTLTGHSFAILTPRNFFGSGCGGSGFGGSGLGGFDFLSPRLPHGVKRSTGYQGYRGTCSRQRFSDASGTSSQYAGY